MNPYKKKNTSAILFQDNNNEINKFICKALFNIVEIINTNQTKIESVDSLCNSDCIAISISDKLVCNKILQIALKEEKLIILTRTAHPLPQEMK